MSHYYSYILNAYSKKQKLLAILIDPEKFDSQNATHFLTKIPKNTTHLFVGGSTTTKEQTESTVAALNQVTQLPLFLFPGDADHISNNADAILFLSLLSGNNPEYLITQQIQVGCRFKRKHNGNYTHRILVN